MIHPLTRAATAGAILAALTAPGFAHNGVVHTGCPYGQSFTVQGLTVSAAFIPAVPKGAPTAAAYLEIANSGSSSDTFTGATSLAGDIGLHQMTNDNGVMHMAPVEGGLAVPAGGSVSLDPMGYHLMMTGMTQPFIEGQCVQMTLHFAHAGDLPIELNIGPMGSRTAPTAGPSAGALGPSSMPGMDMDAMSSMPGM